MYNVHVGEDNAQDKREREGGREGGNQTDWVGYLYMYTEYHQMSQAKSCRAVPAHSNELRHCYTEPLCMQYIVENRSSMVNLKLAVEFDTYGLSIYSLTPDEHILL